jgi:hypothetical protein
MSHSSRRIHNDIHKSSRRLQCYTYAIQDSRHKHLVVNKGNKINTTSCRGNTMTGGHPWIHQENFKTKILAPTSNLTWLRAAVSKYKSGTILREIWHGAKYKSCRTLSYLSNHYLDTSISGLGVMTFWSWLSCWNSGLIIFQRSENFKLLSLVQVQSQKTHNTKLVANLLNFPFVTDTLKSHKQRRSYARWNIVHKWKNLEYIFWFALMTLAKHCRLNMVQNQEKCTIWKW